jgi:uroporphyrinogen III methyltransferase/synthase
VLVPRPAVAREVTSARLRELGAVVDEVVAYRTTRPEALPARALDRFSQGRVDMVTFTSSSTARHFAELLPPELLEAVKGQVVAACIGPTTSATARELGFTVAGEAPAGNISIPGLVSTIVGYFSTR